VIFSLVAASAPFFFFGFRIGVLSSMTESRWRSFHSSSLASLDNYWDQTSQLPFRWIAIVSLGKQFTIPVAIVIDHKLITHGVYRFVRHPAYSGIVLCLFGLGLSFENWIRVIILVVPPAAALLYRIHVEEKVLIRHFGSEYEEYVRRTKRLIPGIY
jgi:protein-S-isoprenylcysteine O-methyltransferase Ste14